MPLDKLLWIFLKHIKSLIIYCLMEWILLDIWCIQQPVETRPLWQTDDQLAIPSWPDPNPNQSTLLKCAFHIIHYLLYINNTRLVQLHTKHVSVWNSYLIPNCFKNRKLKVTLWSSFSGSEKKRFMQTQVFVVGKNDSVYSETVSRILGYWTYYCAVII